MLGGHVTAATVPLEHLDAGPAGSAHLHGRFVRVRNGGAVNAPDAGSGAPRAMPIGDARPDANGDFLFDPGRGGGRLDKVEVVEPDVRARYIQASHFGEVNTYFHLDRIATYVDELLRELGCPSLPPVVAVVNAHHAATQQGDLRDGVRRHERWLPFQGGHYRLPSRRYDVVEQHPLSTDGEIHLGPGWRLVEHGALVRAAGGRYRANASHNAGILYHEYGHHIARYTADFRANALRRPDHQDNRKTAMEEGTADYWAATLLSTPHIWAWHRRHDEHEIHPRSLLSFKTMADFIPGPRADPHVNGTIWGGALWDVREALRAADPGGARTVDLLLLLALLQIGRLVDPTQDLRARFVRQTREPFAVGLSALLQADEILFDGRYHDIMLACFARRGILPAPGVDWRHPPAPDATATAGRRYVQLEPPHRSGANTHHDAQDTPGATTQTTNADHDGAHSPRMLGLLKRVAAEEIPLSHALLSAAGLEALLAEQAGPPLSLIAVGDIMLGGRTRPTLTQHGPDHPFAAVLPLFRRAPIVLGNLEGPLARKAHKEQRTYSYRVNPALATSLSRAGITVMTLANNHLLDCGRAGVLETIDALAQAGIAPLGAGTNAATAHLPVIQQAGVFRVGMLGYYWNGRCAATQQMPGSAMDTPDTLAADIRALRAQVDRVVVTFHWGIPYERDPQPEDRAKAHLAVECGADAVIGHHPHIMQPFEVYQGCPIFYSVGNCAFGSGNSKAEGLLVGLRFTERHTEVEVYPLYVKNRDPRVNYQPKVLAGTAADRMLCRLADVSGPSGQSLHINGGRGTLCLPRADRLAQRVTRCAEAGSTARGTW